MFQSRTTLIRPIAESSYDIATTSTSAAPKSLYSTTTTSSMPIVDPQKRIANTEASITSTRNMSTTPKTGYTNVLKIDLKCPIFKEYLKKYIKKNCLGGNNLT
jgi:hypothetical protein